MMEITNDNSDRQRLFRRYFTRRVTNYAVICSFLALLNYCTTPRYWWVAWVAAGWGLNLILSLVWYLTDCDDETD